MDQKNDGCIECNEIHEMPSQIKNLGDLNSQQPVVIGNLSCSLNMYLSLVIVEYCLHDNHNTLLIEANFPNILRMHVPSTIYEVHEILSPCNINNCISKNNMQEFRI